MYIKDMEDLAPKIMRETEDKLKSWHPLTEEIRAPQER
jgi:hypothetical protein